MSKRIGADLVCQALRLACGRRKPLGVGHMHTDRGNQCASEPCRRRLGQYRMIQSMSRRANCCGNAPMESFFKTSKVERVHQLRYETRAKARLHIVIWTEGFYNPKRMRSSIDYQTSVAAERRLGAA